MSRNIIFVVPRYMNVNYATNDCKTVAGLLMSGALSDERTGLSFVYAAGPPPSKGSAPHTD
jgi:hypothetical protein